MDKPIRLTSYAKAKFLFFHEHGFFVSEETVRQTVLDPERVTRGHGGRWIAQRTVSAQHLLRVIYEERPEERVVVTFYPARRSRYEPSHEV